MSRTTYQTAIAEMVALLADTSGVPVTALSTAGAVKVFDHEPGAEGWLHPCSVTLSPAGMEPTDWLVAVRVYVDGKVVAATAQDLLVDVSVKVDQLLRDGVAFGPSRWAFGWEPNLGCWVAQSDVMIGREDGF